MRSTTSNLWIRHIPRQPYLPQYQSRDRSQTLRHRAWLASQGNAAPRSPKLVQIKGNPKPCRKTPSIDDGLWSIVSVAGYHFTDDLVRWLLLDVAPKTRQAMFEQEPNGNAADVRELWYVIDQLIDFGEMRGYGRDTEMMAINLNDVMLAAPRYGLPLASKARKNRHLALSRTP